MTDVDQSQTEGTQEVFGLDEDALAEASRPKRFNNQVTVKVRVKSAKRDENQVKGGDLKGAPQINLMLEAYGDPDDVKSLIDDPVLWHRLPLPLATSADMKLSNKALAIANFQLHAINPDEVPLARRGDTQDATMTAFRRGQKYALEIWRRPQELVGKTFSANIEISEGKPDADGNTKEFVNLRNIRAELADDESYTSFDELLSDA